MKTFFYISLFLFTSCSGLYNSSSKFYKQGKFNLELTSVDNKFKLNGICKISRDSNILSVYGPFGINLVKLVSRYDSLKIVDIQNKKIYHTNLYNVSGSIFNFFSGIYTSNEEQLLCTLCSLVDRTLRCGSDAGSAIDYRSGHRRKYRMINCSFSTRDNLYRLKIRYYDDNNNASLTGNLSKYANFENVYLKVQQ